MKVFVPVVTATCSISAALAFQSSSTFRGGRELAGTEGFKFTPVRSIQARVIGSPPSWDATAKAFLFKWYDTVELNYRGGMDTVNTASIEGALKYVQSEGIDYTSRGSTKDAWCAGRKNGMKNVMFLDITMAQPQAAVAEFTDKYGEFGPYSAMDSNQCTPTSTNGSTVVFSDACNYINGTNGLPKVGAYVGGEDRSTDARAPYPGTWWFSFPNTCALVARGANKTEACRDSTPAGLCPIGTEPDGVACTFKYKVLGWVPLDDLVGITALTNSANAKYSNFTEFCNDGKVEFKTDANGTVTENIPFWAKPTDATSNTARAQAVVDLYAAALTKPNTLTQVSTTDLANFVALPTVAELTKANPDCYKNIPKCAVQGTSCKRDTYSQLCTVCTDASATGCVKVPTDFTFPALVKATPAPTTKAPTDTPGSTTPSPSTKSAASSLSLSVVSAASVAVSLALSFVLA